MRKRNLKKTILAAALAVPVAFSYPGWAVRAQEDGVPRSSACIQLAKLLAHRAIGTRKKLRLYRAIKRIVEEERLSAITLSCFRLVGGGTLEGV